MTELKTAAELDAMREAGRVVADALAAVRDHAAIGTTPLELDEVAAAVIEKAGATSSFRGYRPRFAPSPYPAVACISVNDAVEHAIPTGYRLTDGDLVSVDCGAIVDGWHGDAAVSFVVGEPRPGDLDLIGTTERALRAGIEAARPGNRLGDISHAIGTIGRAAGYGILADHGGHGIGRAMHEDPYLPNDGPPGRGPKLRVGMAIAIEPMFTAGGTDEYRIDADGWTVRTADGGRAAHCEHTVAITKNGPVVLTVP